MSPDDPDLIECDELAALRNKYARMLAMRLAHLARAEDTRDVKVAMADLALRFPGALREIDNLELAEIGRRIDHLDAVLAGERAAERWALAIAFFHRFARGALCAKRWLAGRRLVTPELVRLFRAESQGLAFPREALEWEAQLAEIAAPPFGRLVDLVHARVARAMRMSQTDARVLAFGTRHQSIRSPAPGLPHAS
jgi:hypothetical protein